MWTKLEKCRQCGQYPAVVKKGCVAHRCSEEFGMGSSYTTDEWNALNTPAPTEKE